MNKHFLFGVLLTIAVLAIGVGVFFSFSPTEAARGISPSYIVEDSPIGNGVDHSFTFYLGSITCPADPELGILPPYNILEGTSVLDSSIRIFGPGGGVLVRGVDFNASVVGENGITVALLGNQTSGDYTINASKTVEYDCLSSVGGGHYTGVSLGNGTFQYAVPVPVHTIPDAWLTVFPNPVLHNNRTSVLWGSTNAQTCYGFGFDTNDATSGLGVLSATIAGDTTLVLHCVSATNDIVEKSVDVGTFYHQVHFYAYQKNSCESADGSRNRTIEPDIRFNAFVDDGADGSHDTIYPNAVPNDGDDRVDGAMPKLLGVEGNVHFVAGSASEGRYTYCGNSAGTGGVLLDSIATPQERTVKLYFAPTNPVLTLQAAIGQSCGDGTLLSDADANALGISHRIYNPDNQLLSLGVGSYGVSILGTYTSDGATIINDSSYQHVCTQPSSVSFPAYNSPDQTMTAYFKYNAPLTAPTLSVASECHDSDSTQNNLSWTSVGGATGYKLYRDGVFLTQINATSYRDGVFGFGATHSYYVSALNGSVEGPQSNTVSLTTPSSCTEPPITGDPTATLTINPTRASVSVGETKQYTASYDPDGIFVYTYGSFDVTTPAAWSALNSSVATKTGQGLFRGIGAGTTGIRAIYSGLTASALLNVSSPGSPDFSISVSPSLRTVQKPGSTSYTVTIVALNGFSGNVTLSIANVPANITTSFAPQTINTQGSAQLTLTVLASANEGRNTFTVTGTSGTLSHSTWADIDVTTTVVGGGFSCTMSTTPQSGSAPLTTGTAVVVTDGVAPFDYHFNFDDGGQRIAHTANPISAFPYTYYSEGSFTPSVHIVDVNNATADCSAPPICVGNCGPGGGGGSDPAVDLKINGKDDLTGANAIIQFDPFNVAQLLINWTSANVTSCSALRTPVGSSSADWGNHAIAIQGNEINTISPGLYDFSISCTPTVADTVPVEFVYCATGDPRPQCQGGVVDECSIVASPTAILSGQSSTLSWSCTQPTGKSCYIDSSLGADVGDVSPIGGSRNVTPADDTYYTLQCTNVADSAALVRVGFLPILKEILPRF